MFDYLIQDYVNARSPDVRVNILMCIIEMRILHIIATLGYIT